jgi:hypothetical protein
MSTTSDRTLDALTDRVAALERVCAEVYQFAGTVGAPLRVLDLLAAAAHGEPLPQASILPIAAEECDAVAELQTRLERVRQAVA